MRVHVKAFISSLGMVVIASAIVFGSLEERQKRLMAREVRSRKDRPTAFLLLPPIEPCLPGLLGPHRNSPNSLRVSWCVM